MRLAADAPEPDRDDPRLFERKVLLTTLDEFASHLHPAVRLTEVLMTLCTANNLHYGYMTNERLLDNLNCFMGWDGRGHIRCPGDGKGCNIRLGYDVYGLWCGSCRRPYCEQHIIWHKKTCPAFAEFRREAQPDLVEL